MAKNISEIPFTEITERSQKIARSEKNTFEKIRGVTNDVYIREIGSKYDWNFLYESSSLTTIAENATGVASVTTGQNTVSFTSASIDSSMTGRLIKFTGYPTVHSFTFTSTSSGTIVPSFQADTNVTNAAFSIFQSVYVLPPDFDRFPKNGGIYRWIGTSKKPLKERTYQEYVNNYSSTPGVPEYVRLVGKDTAGRQLVELMPPPKKAENFGVDYIRTLGPLTETTAGFIISISAGATQVIGNNDTRFLEATSGDWFRCNFRGTGQDSEWYRILNIANNQTLTLATAFANTAVTLASYVISKAPEMPTKLQPAVFFGALRALTLDQTDETAIFYQMKFAEIMSDGKRAYVNRTYGHDMELINEDFMYRR